MRRVRSARGVFAARSRPHQQVQFGQKQFICSRSVLPLLRAGCTSTDTRNETVGLIGGAATGALIGTGMAA
jgi:hypothetical protein